MMRVAEIIVAFVRYGGSIHRLMESRIFLSCDTNAAIFNGCDSEKRTFRLKRKVGPNPDYLSDVLLIFATIFMILFPRNLTV